MSAHDPRIDERDLRDVTALADGTLRGRRREAVEARVRARPELAALLAEQEAAVDALRAIDVAAPARLWVSLAGSVAARHPRRQRGRALAIGLAGAAAAAAAVVVLALPNGTPGAPSVVQAADLGVRAAMTGAPALDDARPGYLRRSIEGVTFPDWRPRFGWRAVASRVDRLQGRRAVTVWYVNRAGRRLAYTIVGGRTLSHPDGARVIMRKGEAFRVLSHEGRQVLTWERRGHTCVVSVRGVDAESLVPLARYVASGHSGRY